jgi:polar amino acid transport system substrate-binding protein
MMRRSVVTILGAACALCLSLAVGVASATAGEPGLAALKAAGVLRVGIASDPPFTFQEANGEWKSFNPELIRKLGDYLGVKIEFVPTGWTTIVAGLQTDKYDIIGASINATPEREKVIDFTIPYSYTGTSFLIRKDNPKNLKTMDDLNNPNVIVTFVTGSDNDEATHKFLPKATYRAIPNGSISDLISEIESRRSDALSTSSYLVAPVMSKYPYYFLPPDPNGVLPVGICWGVPKNNPELKDAMNKFLDQELKNGDIDKLKQQWLTVENSLK